MQSWRCTVFMITFANYAMAHVARKCDTNLNERRDGRAPVGLLVCRRSRAFHKACKFPA